MPAFAGACSHLLVNVVDRPYSMHRQCSVSAGAMQEPACCETVKSWRWTL